MEKEQGALGTNGSSHSNTVECAALTNFAWGF